MERFAERLAEARDALERGAIATAAYVLDESEEDIRRIAGDIDNDAFKPRRVNLRPR